MRESFLAAMPPSPASPPSLDEELRALLEKVRPRITPLFKSYRIPAMDAEDLLQEALLALVQTWPKVVVPEAWLLQTVRYLCYRYLRRERYGNHSQRLDPAVLDEIGAPRRPAQEWRELELDLEALAVGLPPDQRGMLRLYYVQGLTQKEVGDQLGYEASAVGYNIRKSLTILRKRAARRVRRSLGP